MVMIRYLLSTTAAALAFTVGNGSALANSEISAGTTEKTAPSAPVHKALVNRENRALSGVGILTFNGSADGSCHGQTIGPIWGPSIYVREGDKWKWTFGINLPAAGG